MRTYQFIITQRRVKLTTRDVLELPTGWQHPLAYPVCLFCISLLCSSLKLLNHLLEGHVHYSKAPGPQWFSITAVGLLFLKIGVFWLLSGLNGKTSAVSVVSGLLVAEYVSFSQKMCLIFKSKPSVPLNQGIRKFPVWSDSLLWKLLLPSHTPLGTSWSKLSQLRQRKDTGSICFFCFFVLFFNFQSTALCLQQSPLNFLKLFQSDNCVKRLCLTHHSLATQCAILSPMLEKYTSIPWVISLQDHECLQSSSKTFQVTRDVVRGSFQRDRTSGMTRKQQLLPRAEMYLCMVLYQVLLVFSRAWTLGTENSD